MDARIRVAHEELLSHGERIARQRAIERIEDREDRVREFCTGLLEEPFPLTAGARGAIETITQNERKFVARHILRILDGEEGS